MSTLLMTGWCGSAHAQFAAHTTPLMERYAARHGMDFDCVNLRYSVAPPSWMKLPQIGAALHDYDSVLWVDADIVIVDSSESILDEISPDCWQAMVAHKTECGSVPNCGLWFVTREMRAYFKTAWDSLLAQFENHPWWEQAAMLSLMGYEVIDGPKVVAGTPTELFDHTQFLSQKWNHHPRDEARVDHPAFLHATQYHDRLAVIRESAACAT